jgi:hypothetical protein
MPAPDIVLTEDEQRLFDEIRFDWDRPDHQAFARNGEAVAGLMKSLLTRGGISEVRWKYFTDPNYRTGRLKGSWRDLFHRNGNTDEEMVRHFSFLQHLRYLVCGPDLPAGALQSFRGEVARSGNVTSDDIVPLGKFARRETRERGLSPHEACEEYFKLALDCGIWVSYAFSIRNAVKTIR